MIERLDYDNPTEVIAFWIAVDNMPISAVTIRHGFHHMFGPINTARYED